MDPAVHSFRSGGSPLCRLHHPALERLHTEQLEIREIQWPKRRPEQ